MSTLEVKSTKPSSKPLPISEIYGPVASGEGLVMGTPTIFVRLGGCDYRCSWCDSLYAVLPKYVSTWDRLIPEEILDRLDRLGTHVRHVTLSGGNPAIHNLGPLLDLLHAAGYHTAIETQGTIFPMWAWRVGTLTVSPKPPSSGNMTEPASDTMMQFVHAINHKGYPSSLKVVVFDNDDYDYAKLVHLVHPKTLMTIQVGTDQDPGAFTTADILEKLAWLQAKALADPLMEDVRVLPQLHSMLYGLKRGI